MSASRAPRVLVTTSRENDAAEYVAALREAGAEPVLLRPGMPSRSLDAAGGLLLTGGADVDPALYGATTSPLIGPVDRERDDLEIVLVLEARERRVPTLCICRGLQLANVAFGGALVADIPAAFDGAATVPHEVRDAQGRAERGIIDGHVVSIEPDSLLARIVDTLELPTGARHHQAAGACAPALRVVGRTGDGVVEALEASFASPFWLAVQWHPESTLALDGGASRRLFRAFADAARRTR